LVSTTMPSSQKLAPSRGNRVKAAKRRLMSRNPRNSSSSASSDFFNPVGERVLKVANLIPRNQLFPPSKRTTLRYAVATNITTPASSLAAGVDLALNGLFAIDITASAGQPYQWSTIANLWNQYCVYKTRVKATFATDTVSTTLEQLVVGAQLRGPTPVGLAYTAIAARPGSVSTTLANTGESRVVIPLEVYVPDAFGRSLDVYKSDYGSGVGANPGAGSTDYTCVLHLWAANPNGTAVTIDLFVEMEFEVELFDQLQ